MERDPWIFWSWNLGFRAREIEKKDSEWRLILENMVSPLVHEKRIQTSDRFEQPMNLC